MSFDVGYQDALDAITDPWNDIYRAAAEFLNACAILLRDTSDGGVPECVYLSEGPPSWDTCPCLVVHVGGPRIGDTYPLQPALNPGHRATVFGQVNMVTLTATILRCATVIGDDGNLPTPDEHAAVMRTTSADLWSLWNGLSVLKRSGMLFPPTNREFIIEPAIAKQDEGGCVGWQVTIQTALDGYSFPVGT